MPYLVPLDKIDNHSEPSQSKEVGVCSMISVYLEKRDPVQHCVSAQIWDRKGYDVEIFASTCWRPIFYEPRDVSRPGVASSDKSGTRDGTMEAARSVSPPERCA